MYKGIFNDIRDGHPSNTKKGGVCVYYKEYLPLTRRVDICKLIGCIVTEITASNEHVSWHVFTDHQVKIKSNLSSFTRTKEV